MATVILVHGAWHGPWCWNDVADRLGGYGHEVRAVQLRGHDSPPRRIWHRVRDYVDDLRAVAATVPDPPVLIGHSLGGLVVQKYLERDTAAGAVLVASIPPGGTARTVGRIAVRHPLLLSKASLTLRLRPLVDSAALTREWFFSAGTPQSTVDRCHARLVDESYLAFLGTIVAPARPSKVTAPVLVLGAEHDAFFTPDDLRRTAAAYGTDAEIVPGTGHDMMLEDGWPRLTDRIQAWISGLIQAPSPGTPHTFG